VAAHDPYQASAPSSTMTTTPGSWQYPVLRWAHALVWLLLAGSCFLRATRWSRAIDIANAWAVLAFLLHAILLGSVITDRVGRR